MNAPAESARSGLMLPARHASCGSFVRAPEEQEKRAMTPIDLLENRLWQGGFRLVSGRDGEFYALSIYDTEEDDALNVSPLVHAYRAGCLSVGRILADCCKLVGLPEFDARDFDTADDGR